MTAASTCHRSLWGHSIQYSINKYITKIHLHQYTYHHAVELESTSINYVTFSGRVPGRHRDRRDPEAYRDRVKSCLFLNKARNWATEEGTFGLIWKSCWCLVLSAFRSVFFVRC